MEEIDINQLLDYFKSKIIYIIFAMAVAFCASSIYTNKFLTPVYTNSTTILLNQANDNNAISSSDISLNKSLITTYSSIIKSKKVLNQVITNLNLDYSYSELYGKISVSEIPDTTIVKIAVTDKNNERAANIANEIASVFTIEIENFYKIENISVIDMAELSAKPSGTSKIKIIAVVTIAGAVLMVGFFFILFYFDTSVKNEEDIEKATGLPVIGIVPISTQKIKKSTHRMHYENMAKHHNSSNILSVEKEVKKIESTKSEPAAIKDKTNETKKDFVKDAINTDDVKIKPIGEEDIVITQILPVVEQNKTANEFNSTKENNRLDTKNKNEALDDYFKKIEASRVKNSGEIKANKNTDDDKNKIDHLSANNKQKINNSNKNKKK